MVQIDAAQNTDTASEKDDKADEELDNMFREFLYGDNTDDSRKDSVTLQSGISVDEMQNGEDKDTAKTHKQDDLFAVLKDEEPAEDTNTGAAFSGAEEYGYNNAQKGEEGETDAAEEPRDAAAEPETGDGEE